MCSGSWPTGGLDSVAEHASTPSIITVYRRWLSTYASGVLQLNGREPFQLHPMESGCMCIAITAGNRHPACHSQMATTNLVQKKAFEIRLRRDGTKWERAFSTTSGGDWVHVYSDYRWFQTKRLPRQTITAHEDTSVHQNESRTEQQPLPQATHVVDEEKRRTDSFGPDSELIVDIVNRQQEVSDKEELLGPPPESEDTDVLQPSQWDQHETGMDKENPVPSQQLVMEALQEPMQERLQEPPPENTEPKHNRQQVETGLQRACNRHNKIPKTACYHITTRTHQQVETVSRTLDVVRNMTC